jgi:hypothetical protein
MPAHIAANYRTPELIQSLRKAMAQEQKARGAMGQVWANPSLVEEKLPEYVKNQIYSTVPDPADLILRGSWFHGMSDESRNVLSPAMTQLYKTDRALKLANEFGIPGSTHALPSYTRFGEPYGISLTASPSIAAKFAADENIHRVMPLYGGPPTERTLQLWKPEHQKRFNEAYNEAFNEWLNTGAKRGAEGYTSKHYTLANLIENNARVNLLNDIPNNYNPIEALATSSFTPEVAGFNTQFSQNLQNQGIRGLLYNPRRFGEYEMLMLDPKYAMPLDYRPAGSYGENVKYGGASAKMGFVTPTGQMSIRATPGMAKGYQQADPEFAANHARLSDMFNLMPWTERISQDNWKRILEQVDSQYREAVINQLFRK